MRDLNVVVAPGVRMHVVVAGRPTAKPALVLIPGWRLTTSIWRDQLRALSTDRQIIAIDPRSQGESTKTTDGNTPEQRARDLHAALQKLRIRSAVVVGWSQGVQDVAAYVDQFGVTGLAGIVLVDSTVSGGAAGIKAAPEAAANQLNLLSLYAHHPREATDSMMHAIIGRHLSDSEMKELVDDGMKTPPTIGAAMLADDLFGPDRTGALAKMTVPALVIASAASPEIEGQRRMAAALPHGRFEVVADARHAVFVDQPDRFKALVRSFLDSLR